MKKPVKLTVRHRTGSPNERTAEQLAELRAMRRKFQREKPTLEELVAIGGQTESIPLGKYLDNEEQGS